MSAVGGVPLDLLLHPATLAVFGLVIGSFLNVVIHRLPLMLERQWWADVAHQLADAESWRRVFGAREAAAVPPALAQTAKTLSTSLDALPRLGIATPRSRCPSCGHAIAWHENIPLLGWLRLKGRCAQCGARISARYPLVELLTALLFAGIGWRFGAQPVALLWCAAAAALVALAAIDWDTTVLPDALTLPLLWAGLLAAAFGWTLPLADALWGAAAGYLSLWSVYWLFKLTTGKEGMGYGDFKLLAALGAWLGWQMIVPILLMASVIGAVVGVAMKLSAALREGRYVPFGPFLAGAGLVVMLAGADTVRGWIGWA
ncbi:prepilin peptidase [Calidifontimicrobium sp. SYSU G02091]|uniref:prepilin peptidase n=1 Tax=Calidifontimicrobium sp. SYSU G02091 TaxID=2926421 RepID=UPI001F53BB80|nr:A24 family peptidase [Calidifontimicrobium sp. SYSU G02091]MCI1192497.1 prepilin peptidase [Calidifontimicrobium sp. SYSU G02091]